MADVKRLGPGVGSAFGPFDKVDRIGRREQLALDGVTVEAAEHAEALVAGGGADLALGGETLGGQLDQAIGAVELQACLLKQIDKATHQAMVVAPGGEAVVAKVGQPRCQRKFYAPIDAGMIDSLKIDVLHAGAAFSSQILSAGYYTRLGCELQRITVLWSWGGFWRLLGRLVSSSRWW